MAPTNVEIVQPNVYATILAEEIGSLIAETVATKGSCTVALAGGSTPGAVYRAMTLAPLVHEIPWSKVTLLWGDERWVPKASPQSNFHMVEETLLSRLPAGEAPQVVPLSFEAASVQVAAKQYAESLRQLLGASGVIDIVLLGIGEDGHFASIFPGSNEVQGQGTSELTLHCTHPDSGQERVSLSRRCILGSSRVLVLVTGERKASIVHRLFHGTDLPKDLPARVLVDAPNVRWFIDREAAAKIL